MNILGSEPTFYQATSVHVFTQCTQCEVLLYTPEILLEVTSGQRAEMGPGIQWERDGVRRMFRNVPCPPQGLGGVPPSGTGLAFPVTCGWAGAALKAGHH